MNKGIYYSLFTAFMWGFLAIGLKVAGDFVSPITIVWFRFTLAFIVLVAYYGLFEREKLNILARPPLWVLLGGALLGGNYIGFNMGIYLTSPTIGQVFIQVGPVMLAVSGIIFFREKFTKRQAFGLLVVITGLFIFYNEKLSAIDESGIINLNSGIMWLMFGAFSWVGYAIIQKREVVKWDPMQLNLIIFGVPALLLTPVAEFEVFPNLNFVQWSLMAYLGFNTLLAYGSLSYALKYLEANKVSIILILNPLITFAVMIYLSEAKVSWIVPEYYSVLTVVGALTALAGVVITILKRKEVKRG